MSALKREMKAILKQLNAMKDKMVIIEADQTVAFREKGEKLEIMRDVVRRTGWHLLDLLEQYLFEEDGEDDSEHA